MDDATRMAQVFVELADTLTENFDVVDFLQTLTDRCVELLDADASGLMLTDQRGGLTLMAATLERARVLELFELQVQEGPCLECFTTGEAITNVDLAEAQRRWPTFSPAAVRAGFGGTHALPMRLRGQVIGALNLFTDEPVELSATDIGVGQAMADVATIGLLHQRNTHEQTILSEQLQSALHSRVLVEQAKGVLAARADISVNAAFVRMRTHARTHQLSLTEVATAVVEGTLTPSDIGARAQ
ncbi:GAF and ANTAR domain-containing protein [Nocardioides panacis]|uniref:GAF and ANTAR domain-containing protein n=1 Tax=Nocardioides panacis TaxID=2849501 RepID=A0A975T2Z8_9ACTN|nr:GAF and ANTAR domain-containing protein [Nocardioides panacis]QWZ09939.1 GAF and ANTAR domain-containing protein [Nocardioides panacis]